MKFTILEAGPGARRILRSGECPEIDLAAQIGPGEAIFVGEAYSDATHSFLDGQPVAVPSLDQTDRAIAVNEERTRRIATGTTISGIWVTGRDEDARNLTNLAVAAQMRIALGDTTPTAFRDGANVTHSLSPAEVLALWQQSAAYVSALYAASWALKAMNPIPADISNSDVWPARTLPET